MRAVLKALLCVCLTTAVAAKAARHILKQSEACQVLTTSDDIKACVESLTISKQKVLDMINLVNTTVQVYPYTTILKDRQATEYYYAEPVLLEDQLQLMYDRVSSEPAEEVSLIDYYAQIVSIVNSAHDGHFRVQPLTTDPELSQLYRFAFLLPFDLRISSTGAHIKATSDTPSNIADLLYDKGGWVQSIDGKKPDVWVAELAPMCNMMKTQQARYILSYSVMLHGHVSFILCPDMEAIFKNYTVVLQSGDSFTFNFNSIDVTQQAMHHTRQPNTLRLTDIPDERKALEALRSYIKTHKARAHTTRQYPHQYNTSDEALSCSVWGTSMNYIRVKTFLPEDQYYNEYFDVLFSCSALFNSNTYPILVDVRANNGGYVTLRMALFQLLFPQADSRSLRALKPTIYDSNFFLFTAQARRYDTCDVITSLDEDWYRNTVTYTYGEESDVRTQAYYEAFPELTLAMMSDPIYTQNPRSQSDVFIMTDGSCFSSCSDFVNQARETHSAITVGVNAYPSGTSFEDSQCASSLIHPMKLSQEFKDLSEAAGLELQMSYVQSFTNNDHGITGVPHDFQHHQVDLLLKDVTIDTDLNWDMQVSLLVQASKLLKQSSNSTNCIDGTYRRSACNAGEHGIGAMVCKDGMWDTTTCVLHACEVGYVLNATANQCVLDVCSLLGPMSPVPSSNPLSSTSSQPLTSPSSSAASTLCALTAAVVAVLALLMLP